MVDCPFGMCSQCTVLVLEFGSNLPKHIVETLVHWFLGVLYHSIDLSR